MVSGERGMAGSSAACGPGFGLGVVGGKSNVISSFRASKGVDANGTRERIVKTAVHEVGHNFGLEHCTQTPTCLMSDAKGKVASLDQEQDFCPVCRAEFAKQGVKMPDKPEKPSK